MIARLLRAVLGMPSPSVVYTVRRADPPPRSWLARRERAIALQHTGEGPTPAERCQADLEAAARVFERIAEHVVGTTAAEPHGDR